MKLNFLKTLVHEQFSKEGNNMYYNNTDKILHYLNNKVHDKVEPINLNNIEKGKFYFMFYDLQGKSSKLEKFNTILAIDWVDMDKTRYLYGVSINFIPVAIRIVFFNFLFNQRIKTFDKIEGVMPSNQNPITGLSLGAMYKALKTVGFEWSIRKFDVRLMNNAYCLDWNIIHEFLSMSTSKLTGVDDNKLMEIWKSKLDKQEKREQEFISKLLGDYKNMEKEFEISFQSLYESEDNLAKSLNFFKSI